MTNTTALSIYLVAGEASGDLLGAHLMRALRKTSDRPIRFYGIGGERMAAEGLVSLFPYHELSRMGLVEVLPHAFHIFARINMTVEDMRMKMPDIIVTIDVPGFNLRLVEKARKAGIKAKFVHYVAPTVWAYNAWRAEKCATLFDHILTLLPFEPPYFEKAGLPATFVGHPVVAETATGDGERFRQKYGIAADVPLFCLLPGSRRGEIKRHMPVFIRTIGLLGTVYPNLAIALAVPKNVMPLVTPYFEDCPFRTVIMANEEDKKDAIKASNVAIVKSGTVTLEIGMSETPMIVTYRINALSAWMMKRVITIKYVNLINLLLGKEAVPELLQELCNPLMLATAAAQFMLHPHLSEAQKADARAALKQLTPAGQLPSELAAKTILSL